MNEKAQAAFEAWFSVSDAVDCISQWEVAQESWYAALEWAKSGQEPVAWLNYDLYGGNWYSEKQASNDSEPLYTTPPTAPAQPAVVQQDKIDAERYRFLRDYPFDFDADFVEKVEVGGSSLDEAIDVAMKSARGE